MRGFNRVIIAGNLTRDPDVRSTVNKNTFARFAVAINSTRRNANGEVQETTEYVNVVVWGAQAENCGKYLRKGSPILIEGRITTSTYEAKDGSGKRTSTDVTADVVYFLSGGQQNQGGNYQRSNNNYAPQSPQPQQPQQQGNRGNSNNNYNNQSPSFDPPSDNDFGRSIGESGFGGFAPDFMNDANDSDIPF